MRTATEEKVLYVTVLAYTNSMHTAEMLSLR